MATATEDPAISIIVGTSNRPHLLRGFLASLQAQTFRDWQCFVMDEGAAVRDAALLLSPAARVVAQFSDDARVHHVPCGPPVGDWHQTAKVHGAGLSTSEWLMFPNDDGYYVPTFLERMISMGRRLSCGLVYCDWLYRQMGHVVWPALPATGHVDVGGFIVRRDVFERFPWTHSGQTSDGQWIESIVAGGVKHGKCGPGALYVQN